MANSQKVVDVPDIGVVAFPGDMEDTHVANYIKIARAKKKFSPLQTEESEHARQLKPAQPLSTAIPHLPQWANTPVLSGLTFDAQIERAEKSGHPEQAEWLRKQKSLQDKAYEKNKANHPIATGIGTGVGEFAEGMTSPANLALIAGAPESKLLSAFFSMQALKGSYANAQQAQEAYLKGNNQEAIKYATEAALGLGIAGLAGHHAVKDIPVPEGVKDFVKSEEGSVGPQGTVPPKEDNTLKILTDGKHGGYTLDYWLKNHPDVKILSVGKESIDPSTLRRLQGWTRESKLDEWKTSNANVKDMPPVEVVRTPHGDYLYDGTHRAEFATRQGEKVPATVYTIKNRNDATPAPNINDVKAKAAELKPTTAYKSVDQSQPFFLKSENLITEKMKGPMPAEDVHKMLLSNGVKPEEMKWTGLDELLQGKGKQKVTPQEIQEHLAGNNLQVQEVEKGTGGLVFRNHFPTEAALMGAVNGDEMLVKPDGTLRKGLSVEHSNNGWNLYDSSTKENPTKFGSYVLPGAEPGSYRELLLTMPEGKAKVDLRQRSADALAAKDHFEEEIRRNTGRFLWEMLTPEQQSQYGRLSQAYQDARDAFTSGGPSGFRSSHWDEPNPASHVRFDDRKGQNGEKILFIEEAQDDWAQKIRKEGVREDPKEVAKQPMKATRYNGYWEIHLDDGRFVTNVQDWQHPEVKTDEQAIAEARRRIVENPEKTRIAKEGQSDRPFKKTDEWTSLVMKRMLKYAVDHGYDAVAWAPGDVHFGRWGSQRFDWKKNGDHWEVAGTEQHGGNAGGVNIEEEAERQGYLQKGAAKVKTEEDLKKIVKEVMSRESNDAQIDTQTKKIWNRMQSEPSGTSMPRKEGFEAYYDQIVPQAANKLGKPWGAKVGETKVVTETTPKKTYVGPSYTYEQLKKIADDSKGTMIEGAAKWVADSVKQGSSLEEAMDAYGSPMLAEKLGGSIDVVSKKKTVPVPYLPITPQMRAGVKSIPYSLFSIPLAAGALGLSQVKAHAAVLNPNNVRVKDPNGHVHFFQTQAQADAFKKAARIL